MRDPPDPADARMIRRADGLARGRRPGTPSADPEGDTVRLKRPGARAAYRGHPVLAWVGGIAIGVLLAALAAWALWPSARPIQPPQPASVVSAPRVVAVPHPPSPGLGPAGVAPAGVAASAPTGRCTR